MDGIEEPVAFSNNTDTDINTESSGVKSDQPTNEPIDDPSEQAKSPAINSSSSPGPNPDVVPNSEKSGNEEPTSKEGDSSLPDSPPDKSIDGMETAQSGDVESTTTTENVPEEQADKPTKPESPSEEPMDCEVQEDSSSKVELEGESEKQDEPKDGANKPDLPIDSSPPNTIEEAKEDSSNKSENIDTVAEPAKENQGNSSSKPDTNGPEAEKDTGAEGEGKIDGKAEDKPEKSAAANNEESSDSPKVNSGTNSDEKSSAVDDDVCVIGEELNKEVNVPGSSKPVNVTSNGTGTKSTSKQPHPCLVCKKVVKCKFNIVGNGDIRHLCEDLCFKTFRANPTQYLRSEGQSKTKQNTESTGSNIKWTPKMQLCTHCAKAFKTDQFSKFEVKGGEIKPFCSAGCLRNFKSGMKICAFCKSDTKGKKERFMASVYDGNHMAEFCTKECHEKFVRKFTPQEADVVIESERNTRPKRTTTTPSANKNNSVAQNPTKISTVSTKDQIASCSVCGKNAKVKHDVTFEGKTHKLCSDGCFSAFRYANKLSTNECSYCGAHCFAEGSNPHTIQFEGNTKKFCSITCVNAFKVGKTKIIPCAWCSAKKLNFDMIERVDANNTYQLFCSLNCLSLYRVNLQATSNHSVQCDQCRKMAPAQYHLTMSDATVRNFCDYACVMKFQGQFAKPQNQTDSNQTRSPTPMAQSKNTASTPQATRQSTRQTAKRVMQQQPPVEQGVGDVPVISNVMSLASGNAAPSPAGRGKGVANNVPSVGAGTQYTTNVGSQIIIQPPPPKAVRNKALLCKPFTMTKATTCRPHTTTRETQTDESMFEEKKKPVLFPVPVPIYVPMPMAMYNAPQPYPVPFPIPIPVPFFIPTTKKSADSILRHIKEIQERMPSDPFEAELLMMAEAVATGEKSDSSSESDPDDGPDQEPNIEPTLPALGAGPTPEAGSGGDMGEDMLSMALRMAEMRSSEDAVLDLEDSITTTPVPIQPPPIVEPEPEFSTIDHDSDILSASRGRGGWRGKRRRGRAPGSTTPRAKRIKVEEPTPEPEPAPAPVITPILSDANMVLKYSFGVNAWRHWVLQKNEQLEKASSGRSGKLKLFKTDILQCTSDELNYSLCLFVKEVRKPNGEEYAPDSIYYLCLGIQQYLFENSRIDNIFTDFYYEKFTECLNGILQRYEVRLNTQGLIVCRIEEEHLWECKQLGAHSPHVLLNTLIYFNTRYFMLRTAEDHVRLSFSHIMKHWKKTNVQGTRTPGRSVYLRYYAPVSAKDANQKSRKREEVPVYEQAENVENPLRCPVKLYEFYLSKCPESIRNRNDVFYLVPERSCVPDSPVWYSTASLGVDAMSKMLNRVRVVREIQERHLHHQAFG